MQRSFITMTLAAGLSASLTGSANAGALGDGGVLNMEVVGTWDQFGGSYADVWADGDYAYMGHFGSSSIDIINISDPTNPVLVTEYDLTGPNNGSAQDVKVANGLLFIGIEGSGSNGVHIVDVRDPENPIGLVDINIESFNAIHNVFYDNGYLYLADSHDPKVVIIDLTTFDPDNPPASPITTSKWVLDNIGSSFVHDVTIVDGRLYCSAWDSGVWIYDVSDISASPPQFLGNGPGNNTHSAWPTADGKYVICGEERTGGGIVAYRITDSGVASVNLTVTDTVTFPTNEASSVHNQAVIGNRVYNSWYAKGIQVFDIDTDTGVLTLAAAFDTAATPLTWGIYPFLGPNLILASDINAGFLVLKITDPAADLNGDGVVDVDDLVAVIVNWGPCVPAPPAACTGDIDGSGTVDVDDLVAIILGWSL